MSRLRPRTRAATAVALAIGLTIGSATLTTTADGAPPAAGPDKVKRHGADTVLRNGFVYTVDRRNSVAQAIAVDDGVIRYVGSNRGAERFIGRNTKVVDLKGRMVMPGLHEGHIHDVTNSDLPDCNLGAGPLTVPEFQAKVQACLDDPQYDTSTPGSPDNFLQVSDLYFQFLRPAGTVPNKSMLDALDNPDNRPITVTAAITGHNILVNQAALDLAGITRDTPDPVGGRIDHDPDGEPNGILQDSAQDLVYAHVPPPPPVSFDREVELAGERMQEFSREGITSFFVPGFPGGPETMSVFNALQDEGGLTSRANFSVFVDPLTQTPQEIYAQAEAIRDQFENPKELSLAMRSWRPGKQTGPKYVPEPGVAVTGVKILTDGIAQFPAQTAYLSEPYLDENGEPRTDANALGELYVDKDVLNKAVAGLERRGFQSHIHAIGDEAVTITLDAFAYARHQNPKIKAHQTIAHAEIVKPSDYKRFGRLDITASMGLQWAKPAPDSTEAVKPYLGDRWDWYEPSAPITKNGGKVSLGSDCCLDPFDEFFGLEVSILREADWGPEFPQFDGKLNALPGLSLREGIRAVTINGAYQMHQEKVSGSLEVGKLADLIVLNQNITKVPLDDISNTDVLLTLVGGKTVWKDPTF
jgi:predicted amidohydrolase YtcJ